ncbi:uncharacterized protein LOC135198977 [Macrobrachium nipponense]|uniref:uncharacterized protein LOC135198977 n=1 Tax=Macrobrachium nipponense TaxID=159736 RepID=UPI0030C7A8B6
MMLRPVTSSSPVGGDSEDPSLDSESPGRTSALQARTREATIPLKGKKGRMVRLRGLLDTCAERTFIKRSALERLQYRSKGVEKIALRGYLTSKPVHEYEMISVAIPHKDKLIIMDCIVVDELPEYAKKFDDKRSLKSLCKTKISLADKDFDLPVENQSTIDLLIGVDNVYNILHPGFKRVRNLILLPTIFGYVVTGTCSAPPTRETHVTIMKLAVQTEEIEATHNENPKTDLDALWSLDRLGIDCSELREQDQRVLKDFESTITYSEIDKQYVVALPWRTNRFRLKTNFCLAMSRLRQQTIKFQKDVDYLDHYQKILQEQEDRGFIEKVIYNKSDVDCHYFSHHGVLKDSATTPIRIVFDCSSKQGKNGLSLNDCLWTGPHDLLRVLLQFRTNTFACIGDIEKAFLMVQLREEDRNYTRFLWLENPTDPNSKLIVYRFRVVLFGATCSPFLLNATIKHHLSTVVSWLPRSNTVDVVERLKRGLYVDNLQFTANSESEFNANKIFAQAHLYLKEWVSNSESIQTIAAAYQIEPKQKKIHKVLGLNWDIIKDVLTINPTRINRSSQTKREILSTVAQIYDPLGLLLPVTMKARIFLQKLWKQHLDWDEQLANPLQEEWSELRKDLEKCIEISFPRSASLGTGDTLHIFCDASETSYGCVAYRANGESSNIIMAKGRVAPIKELTIPKLELMALLLGARMAKFIIDSFDEKEFKQLYVWSDSKVALSWIVSSNVLPVFVRNRVIEINSLIPGNTLTTQSLFRDNRFFFIAVVFFFILGNLFLESVTLAVGPAPRMPYKYDGRRRRTKAPIMNHEEEVGSQLRQVLEKEELLSLAARIKDNYPYCIKMYNTLLLTARGLNGCFQNEIYVPRDYQDSHIVIWRSLIEVSSRHEGPEAGESRHTKNAGS